MTEMSWAEKTAILQRANLDLQLAQIQAQINELNVKIDGIEKEIYQTNTLEENQDNDDLV
jgi:hypothetical protein